jgi:hypothetical protein
MSTPPIYANAVNFSSYEKFISYADTTIDYVYQRGFMPDSLITYTQFWQDPEGAPTLLSTFLPGFDLLQDGKVVEPGRAVARPGANTTVASLPVTLNAGASLFSTSYAWTVSPLYDGIVTFSDSSSATPELMVIQGQSLPEGSDVMLGLTTANANGESTPAEVTIRVDSTTQPANPTFLSAIKEPGVLSGSGNPDRVGRCTGCHNRGDTPPPFIGIPVYFDDASYTADPKDLYRNVLDRVDLVEPENSLMLRKAIGLHHGGGLQLSPGDDTNPPDPRYIALLNWIRNGAPCSGPDDLPSEVEMYCP